MSGGSTQWCFPAARWRLAFAWQQALGQGSTNGGQQPVLVTAKRPCPPGSCRCIRQVGGDVTRQQKDPPLWHACMLQTATRTDTSRHTFVNAA